MAGERSSGQARRWAVPLVVVAALAAVVVALLIPRSQPAAEPSPAASGQTPTAGRGPAAESSAPATMPTTSPSAPPQPCVDSDAPYWRTDASSKRRFTHLSGTSFDSDVKPLGPAEVDSVLVLRSAVTITPGTAPVDRPTVLAEIERRHKLSLAGLDAVTPSGPVELEIPQVDTSRPFALAAYVGRREWSGRWSYHWCESGTWHQASGTWKSFETRTHQGVVACLTTRRDRRVPGWQTSNWSMLACSRAFGDMI